MEEKKPIDEVIDPSDFDDEELEEDVSESDEADIEEATEEVEETEPSKSQEDLEKEKRAEAQAKKNAHFAEQRRLKEAKEREEREQKIRSEATLKAELGILKVNPFTDEPITDEEDLKIYKIQKELDDEGKDPIGDLPKKLAEINRKAIAEAKSKEEKELAEKTKQEEKISAEIKELREKYPKVDTAKLAGDELFKECLKGRAGRWSQVEIYELYLTKKAELDRKNAEELSKETVNKGGEKMSKVPSASANGKVTPVDISSMSDEDFAKYWADKYES